MAIKEVLSMLCENCKNNCCGPSFKGCLKTSDDMNQKLLRILLSREETDKITNAGFKKFLCFVDDKAYVKMNSDGSCMAFKNGKCEMYDVRPLACKLYPYYFDASYGILKDDACKSDEFKLNDYHKEEAFKLIQKRIKDLQDID